MEQTQFLTVGVERHRLGNGLTILTREDHTVPVVSTMLWYRVGSRNETPGTTGISHFLEHMMFKGTDRYDKGEIDYITTRNGGSNNAFTSNDYTAYYFNFASDRWQQALEIEANRMRNNRFDPHEFELEKQVVLEELKMDLDTPWGALRQAVEINSFEHHPYKYPVIGLYEDLVRITLDKMVDHYQRFYSPNNAILVIVGDFHRDEALKRIEEFFGALSPGQLCQPVTEPELRRSAQRRVEIRKPTHVPRMLLAFPSPSIRQREHYAVEILDNVLSEGKLGRFYQRLVEKERLASVITTEFNETIDPYLFFVRAELQENADVNRVEAVIFEEIEKLRQERISERELKRAKNQCIMQTLADFETSLGQAAQLGLLETLDRFEYWQSYREKILSLTAEEVRNTAEPYWSADQATVGIILNDGSEQISVPAEVLG